MGYDHSATSPPPPPPKKKTQYQMYHFIPPSTSILCIYRGADKSLARPTSQCILFDGENISFDASLVIYIYIYIYK